jgi:phage portal protein BeeE
VKRIRRAAPATEQRNLLLTPSASFGATSYHQPWDRLRGIKGAHDREALVAALTQAIAADIANVEDLPIRAIALGTDEDVTATSHYAFALNVAPSSAMDAMTFRQHFANAISFSGECYIVEHAKTLTPLIGGSVEIHPAGPGSFAPDGSPLLVAGYTVRDEGGREIARYDGLGRAVGGGAIAGSVLHRAFIPHPENPLRANPPVAAALLPSEVLHLQRQATKSILLNDGMPAAVLSIKAPVEGAHLTQDELDDATRRINSKMTDGKRRVVVLNGDSNLQPFASSSPLGAGWKEVADQARDEILAVWRAPLSVLGASGGMTYENQRISLRHYYAAVLLPTLNLLTSTLNQHARRLGYRLVVDTSRVAALNESSDELATRAATLHTSGIATLNEARELMGLPPVEGGDELPGTNGGAPAPVSAPGSDGERGALPFVVRAAGPDADDYSEALDTSVEGVEDELAAYAQRFHARVARMVAGGLRRRAGLNRDAAAEVPVPLASAAEIIDPSARTAELLADLAASFDDVALTVGTTVAVQLAEQVTPSTLTLWRELAEARLRRLVIGGTARAGWTQALVDDVQAAITAAYEAGESVDGAIARVNQALDVDGADAASIGARAERIARTELSGLMNEVALAQMTSSGVVSHKTWYSIADNRTRGSHLELNGVTVAIDEPFTVGGVAAQGPHDANLPAGETVNCRCRLIPVVGE